MIATCPSRFEITEYLLGQLPPEAFGEVDAHLDDCPACRAAAETLEQNTDNLVARLREPAPDTWEPNDPVLTALLERAAKLPASASPPQRIRDYLLLEQVGQGGMGVVYRARHERLAREVALKLLTPEKSGQSQAAVRLEREMPAIGQLQHEHIVAALDAGVVNGTYYLAMELVDGCDVSHLVDRIGPLPVAAACEIVRQAALGLQAAHEQGILHRDIKPSNLLVTQAGVVKVADLGLALFHHAENPGERTSPSMIQGTLDYIAPEQSSGEPASERSDLYALGVTLFKLLTGRGPFAVAANPSPLQMMLAHRDDSPPRLRTIRADVPKELDALVARLLRKNPVYRPESARELATALAPFCVGANIAALVQAACDPQAEISRIVLPAVASPVPSLQRWLRPAVAVALLALIGGGILAAVLQKQQKDERPAQNQPVEIAAGAKAAQQRQQQWSEKLNSKVQQKNSIDMELTLIPPGEFTMGSPAPEVQRAIAIEQREVPEGWPMHYFIRKVQIEFPEHKVKLTRPFLMGTHEVTVAQWDAFAEDSGYQRLAQREPEKFGEAGFGRGKTTPDAAGPMTYVTWDDAKAFCNWLSNKEQKTYRLPTEAEWEYACRAGTTTRWFTGDEVESLRDYAWTLQTSGATRDVKRNSADVQPQHVGRKKPNPFGLHDITGNAWEWCRDHFHQEYYAHSPEEDPPGPKMLAEKAFPGTVVLRGGGNGFRENETRSATRWFLKPYAAESYLGFRVVCELSDAAAQ